MKKFLAALTGALIVALSAVGLCACGGGSDGGKISVYAPDGAPALAIARLISEKPDLGKEINCKIVGAEEIKTYVTYEDESKNADLCILPVNAASKLLGNGTRYKMLGAVTHGNLYIAASKDKGDITPENFAESLTGKKVGVVNLAAFPGAAFKLILSNYGIKDSVTLENVLPAQVTGTESAYDYFVIPEPEASFRAGNAKLNLKVAGSLQELYGENGYPQAVLVAKKSLIESDPKFVADFMGAMTENANWLLNEEVSTQKILSAVVSCYPETSFNAQTLTRAAIRNSSVRFSACAECKASVNKILGELKGAGDAAATTVSEEFFYIP